MFGTNPIRPPLHGDGHVLAVQEVFYTLQGEGPRAGQPAVFVRLGGCNLACTFCDTEFESFTDWTLTALLEEVKRLSGPHTRLVVLTGGEPFRQPISPLCDALLERGYSVQIETNGTLYRPLDARVEIVCSPKHAGTGFYAIRPDLLARVTAFKFLLDAEDSPYREVPEVGQSNISAPVYVQPIDQQDAARNTQNLAYTTEYALRHGYRLSVQLHKWAGIR
jgi:7-carboxy-7-deazaguanine synthase